MGQTPAPQKRPPFTRLHAVIVLASIMFVATVASFFSNDVAATRNTDSIELIQLNEEALSQIHASLEPLTLGPQIEAVQLEQIEESVPVQPLTQTIIKVKSGHSLSSIFRKHKFSHQDLYRIMQKGKIAKALRNLQPGKMLEIESDAQGQLHSLSYQVNRLQSINVIRSNDDFDIQTFDKPVEKRVSFSEGLIKSSLFEAGKQAGLSDALVMEMAASLVGILISL